MAPGGNETKDGGPSATSVGRISPKNAKASTSPAGGGRASLDQALLLRIVQQAVHDYTVLEPGVRVQNIPQGVVIFIPGIQLVGEDLKLPTAAFSGGPATPPGLPGMEPAPAPPAGNEANTLIKVPGMESGRD